MNQGIFCGEGSTIRLTRGSTMGACHGRILRSNIEDILDACAYEFAPAEKGPFDVRSTNHILATWAMTYVVGCRLNWEGACVKISRDQDPHQDPWPPSKPGMPPSKVWGNLKTITSKMTDLASSSDESRKIDMSSTPLFQRRMTAVIAMEATRQAAIAMGHDRALSPDTTAEIEYATHVLACLTTAPKSQKVQQTQASLPAHQPAHQPKPDAPRGHRALGKEPSNAAR